MIKKEIFQPLPFFYSIASKNRYKEQCHNDVCTWKLIQQCDRIMPFVLLRDPSPNVITSVMMYCYDDGVSYDLTAEFTFTYSSVLIDGVYKDEIQYFGAPILEQPKGLMYLEIYDGLNTWYSEDFYIECCFTDDDDIDSALLINDSAEPLLVNDTDTAKYKT